VSSLLLAPHNDDETLFASFLCLHYHPHVVICLKSERMGHENYHGGPPVSAKTREFETQMAMKVLGCEWTQWPVLDDNPARDQVEAFMWGLRDPSGQDDWDIVIAPAVEDEGHDQHNMIGEIAAVVFKDVPIVSYLTYTRTGGRSRNGTQVEFEPGWVPLKLQALACYKSQASHEATYGHFIDNGLREYVA
jgi:LmbE family N-acetylglucosaminyl deacetylase